MIILASTHAKYPDSACSARLKALQTAFQCRKKSVLVVGFEAKHTLSDRLETMLESLQGLLLPKWKRHGLTSTLHMRRSLGVIRALMKVFVTQGAANVELVFLSVPGYGLLLALPLLHLLGVKVVVDYRDASFIRPNPPSKLLRRLEIRLISYTTAITTAGTQEYHFYLQSVIPRIPVIRFENGSDHVLNNSESIDTKYMAEQRDDISGDQVVVLAGNLYETDLYRPYLEVFASIGYGIKVVGHTSSSFRSMLEKLNAKHHIIHPSNSNEYYNSIVGNQIGLGLSGSAANSVFRVPVKIYDYLSCRVSAITDSRTVAKNFPEAPVYYAAGPSALVEVLSLAKVKSFDRPAFDGSQYLRQGTCDQVVRLLTDGVIS